MMPDAEFDSFLTIGMTGPATIPGAISTIGIDFASWTESSGISADNGAVRATPHLHTLASPRFLWLDLIQAHSMFFGVGFLHGP